MSRTHTITEKIETEFGSLYAHVEFNAENETIEVRFSSPGKFSDTTMGEVIDKMGQAVTNILNEINEIE